MKKFFLLLAASCTIASTQTYSTSFDLTEDPISEGGKWICGGTAGLDWNDVRTANGRATGYNDPELWWTDATALLSGTWKPDQTVTATAYCSEITNNITEIELRLRSSISAHNNRGYEVLFKPVGSSDMNMMIVRWNGPVQDYTVLKEVKGSSYAVNHGDVLKATMIGNVITAYINGVQKARVSDDVYASGSPGFGFCNAFNDPVPIGQWGISDWSANCTGGSTANTERAFAGGNSLGRTAEYRPSRDPVALNALGRCTPALSVHAEPMLIGRSASSGVLFVNFGDRCDNTTFQTLIQ